MGATSHGRMSGRRSPNIPAMKSAGRGKKRPKLGAERLRQFVEGVDAKPPSSGRKFPVPQPDALQAIIAFVTNIELNLLSLDELEENMPGPQAALRLSEFMYKDNGLPRTDDLLNLTGSYLSVRPNKDGWQGVHLYFERPSDDKVFRVTELRTHHSTESKDQALTQAREHVRADSDEGFLGWAVLSPEDSLILFMKCDRDGLNHRYICLEEVGEFLKHLLAAKASAMLSPDDAPQVKVLMMEHKFGHDLSAANKKQITDAFLGDLLVFEKNPAIIVD